MNPTDTANLLRYCSGIDQWLNTTNADEAAVMVAGWTDLLADVPPEFAGRVAREHYQQANVRTIQPGDIAGAWRTHQQAEAARDITDRLEAIGDLLGGPGAADYLRDLAAAHTAGRDLRTVPRPATVRVITHDAEVRGRRCQYHALCACDHEKCRDGWSDEEGVIVGSTGRRYPAAQRCPHCHDALKMAEERGIARKPSRTARR